MLSHVRMIRDMLLLMAIGLLGLFLFHSEAGATDQPSAATGAKQLSQQIESGAAYFEPPLPPTKPTPEPTPQVIDVPKGADIYTFEQTNPGGINFDKAVELISKAHKLTFIGVSADLANQGLLFKDASNKLCRLKATYNLDSKVIYLPLAVQVDLNAPTATGVQVLGPAYLNFKCL